MYPYIFSQFTSNSSWMDHTSGRLRARSHVLSLLLPNPPPKTDFKTKRRRAANLLRESPAKPQNVSSRARFRKKNSLDQAAPQKRQVQSTDRHDHQPRTTPAGEKHAQKRAPENIPHRPPPPSVRIDWDTSTSMSDMRGDFIRDVVHARDDISNDNYLS